MKISNIRIMNFEGAYRGMRNPKDSWAKSDSEFGLAVMGSPDFINTRMKVAQAWVDYKVKKGLIESDEEKNEAFHHYEDMLTKNGILRTAKISDIVLCEYAFIGPADMNLATTLEDGGTEHRKFMRQIFVSMDITAPLFWWKEMDKYQVGTTTNSCSTMHKLDSKPIDLDMFEIDPTSKSIAWGEFENVIDICESLRIKYKETGNKDYWRALIELLPSSWNQTRTWTGNYEVIKNQIHQRKNHKLKEWHEYIDVMETFPYAEYFFN